MSSNKQARRILITAGPAVAEIDSVRKITNHSTGSLGTALAEHAHAAGHAVTLLRSSYCTAPVSNSGFQQVAFTDGPSLLHCLEAESRSEAYDAVWHAAAVSDYIVDRICDSGGQSLDPNQKLNSRSGTITLHLKPSTKIIAKLQFLFPESFLIGWKYETHGSAQELIAKARQQLTDNKTHACVANGPAYGNGFCVCLRDGTNRPSANSEELAETLLDLS